MKIGVIGLGNMATAIIGGILNKNIVSADQIYGFDVNQTAVDAAKNRFFIQTASDNRQLAAEADLILLAVKPQYAATVIEEIKDVIHENTIIVSIMAGKSIQFMEEAFGKKVKIVRTMPNTPALVGEGCTAISINDLVDSKESDMVLSIFQSFGKASLVDEKLMDVVVGVSGSSPAYVFLFIEALADGAVLHGMPRKQAYEFAAQAVLGSAKMVLETGMHPGALKDMVCSPGGTTIEAVKVLEQMGFRGAVMEAMDAATEKSKTL